MPRPRTFKKLDWTNLMMEYTLPKSIRKIHEKDQELVNCLVNGVPVNMEVDSGSDIVVFDEHQFAKLKKTAPDQFVLKACKTKVKALSGEIKLKGCFTAEFKSPIGERIEAKAVVTVGDMGSPPLMSRSVGMTLGYLKIDKWARLNEVQVKMARGDRTTDEIAGILLEFESMFHGVGCLEY